MIRVAVREAMAILTLAALLVFLAFILHGCSSPGRHIDAVSPVGSITVVFVRPDEYSQGERADVLEAEAEIRSAWLADFRRPLPAFSLHVLDVEEFECGGVMAIGCNRRDGTVAVVRGPEDSLHAYYHELCHKGAASRFHGADARHEDPAWTSWNERGAALSARIADRRW